MVTGPGVTRASRFWSATSPSASVGHMPHPDPHRQVASATASAASLARTQRAQEEVRKRVFVGYRMEAPQPAPMIPGGPGPNISTIWYPAAFDPTGPPQHEKAPDGGLLNTVVPPLAPLQPYGPVKEKYDATTAKI